jgi:hypothetical protein
MAISVLWLCRCSEWYVMYSSHPTNNCCVIKQLDTVHALQQSKVYKDLTKLSAGYKRNSIKRPGMCCKRQSSFSIYSVNTLMGSVASIGYKMRIHENVTAENRFILLASIWWALCCWAVSLEWIFISRCQTNAFNIFRLGITYCPFWRFSSSNAGPSRSHRFIILHTNRLRLSCWLLAGTVLVLLLNIMSHGIAWLTDITWPSRVWLWHRKMIIDIRHYSALVSPQMDFFLSSYKLLSAISPLANVVRQR